MLNVSQILFRRIQIGIQVLRSAKCIRYNVQQLLIVNQMITHSNPPKRHREISFSESFQYQNNNQKSKYQSPNIAIEQKIQSLSKEFPRYQSPLHNLHYKYLPNSKKVAQLEYESVRQIEMLKQREESSNKIQNFSQINKRINKILVDIQQQENRNQYNCQKFAIQMSRNSPYTRSNVPASIKSQKDQQYCRKAQSQLIRQTKRLNCRPQSQKQAVKQNYFTPTKINKNPVTTSSNNLSGFDGKCVFKQPLSQKRMNQNHRCSIKERQLDKSRNNAVKTSVYANLTQKRTKGNKENKEIIVRGKNVHEQWQRLQNKIHELQKIKKQLQIQLATKKYEEQPKIVQSHLTKISSQQTFKDKQSSIIQGDNFFFEESNMLSSQCQDQLRCESKFQKQTNTQSNITHKKSSEKVIMEDVQLPKILRKITERKNKVLSQINQPNNYNFRQSKQYLNQVYSKQTDYKNFNLAKDQFDRKITKRKMKEDQLYQKEQEIKIKSINQKNRLLNQLKCQIKLDEQLRKAKKWFQKLKITNKWNILLNQFQKKNFQISDYQMKTAFALNPDQQNPFYNVQEGDFTIDELVKIYLAADGHWMHEVTQNFKRSFLLSSNFNKENIDISSKGYINIQDLTRYLNCQLDSFYRNRDVYLIYHRLKTSQKLYYSSIIDCLSNE